MAASSALNKGRFMFLSPTATDTQACPATLRRFSLTPAAQQSGNKFVTFLTELPDVDFSNATAAGSLSNSSCSSSLRHSVAGDGMHEAAKLQRPPSLPDHFPDQMMAEMSCSSEGPLAATVFTPGRQTYHHSLPSPASTMSSSSTQHSPAPADSLDLSTPSATPYTDEIYGRNNKAPVPDHVPRPINCFMLYISDQRRQNSPCRGTNTTQVCTEAGRQWHTLTDAQKRPFKEEAERLKKLHKLQFPNYKYKPEKKTKTVKRPSASQKLKPEPVTPTSFIMSTAHNTTSSRLVASPVTVTPSKQLSPTLLNSTLMSHFTPQRMQNNGIRQGVSSLTSNTGTQYALRITIQGGQVTEKTTFSVPITTQSRQVSSTLRTIEQPCSTTSTPMIPAAKRQRTTSQPPPIKPAQPVIIKAEPQWSPPPQQIRHPYAESYHQQQQPPQLTHQVLQPPQHHFVNWAPPTPSSSGTGSPNIIDDAGMYPLDSELFFNTDLADPFGGVGDVGDYSLDGIDLSCSVGTPDSIDSIGFDTPFYHPPEVTSTL